MKHSALSVAAMGAALVWPVFFVSTVSAEENDRKHPHTTKTSTVSFITLSPQATTDYPITPVFKRDDVTPTSIPDGDNWSWSDLPHTSATKDWSSIFDGLISSYVKSALSHPLPEWASDVTSTTPVMATTTVFLTTTERDTITATPTDETTVVITTTVTETRTLHKNSTDPITGAGAGPVVKNVVTTQTWTYVSPLKGHQARDAVTAKDTTLVTAKACAKETTTGIPKAGCVMGPVCGSDKNTLTTTPGLHRRISTSTCVERGTTCDINGVLQPSDDWCNQDCICVCH